MRRMRKEGGVVNLEPEITRRSVLEEALEDQTVWLRSYSKMGRSLEPLPGYEKEFDRQRRKCELLREMIRSLENEGVRKAMADWQLEEMKGEKQVGLFDGERPLMFREGTNGHTDTDLPDHP